MEIQTICFIRFQSTNLFNSKKEENLFDSLCYKYIKSIFFLLLAKIKLRKIHSNIDFVDLKGNFLI